MANEIKKNKAGIFIKNNLRTIVTITITALIHIFALFYIGFDVLSGNQEKRVNEVFKMVDIQEYIPPPPPEEKKEEKKIEEKKEEVVEINKQDNVAEEVIETDKEVKEVEIDYLPQHKISDAPVLPTDEIKSKIVYPPLANKQGIEGIVYLELFIDQFGNVKKIDVLKDPGYGFAEAALKALEGIKVKPAFSNGVPVAVRFRYPIRFTLKK